MQNQDVDKPTNLPMIFFVVHLFLYNWVLGRADQILWCVCVMCMQHLWWWLGQADQIWCIALLLWGYMFTGWLFILFFRVEINHNNKSFNSYISNMYIVYCFYFFILSFNSDCLNKYFYYYIIYKLKFITSIKKKKSIICL